MDFAGAEKRRHFFIQQPRPQHAAECGPVRLTNGISGFNATLGDSLQHG
jgi:hypothetical protein